MYFSSFTYSENPQIPMFLSILSIIMTTTKWNIEIWERSSILMILHDYGSGIHKGDIVLHTYMASKKIKSHCNLHLRHFVNFKLCFRFLVSTWFAKDALLLFLFFCNSHCLFFASWIDERNLVHFFGRLSFHSSTVMIWRITQKKNRFFFQFFVSGQHIPFRSTQSFS